MTIGVAGLMSLDLLDIDYKGKPVPNGFRFPLISYLINGILKKGYKVVAYTCSEGISEPLVFEDKNITVCVGRREPHAGRDFFKSERADLLYLMKKYPADVISAQWSYEYAWAAIDSGIPTLVTVRDHATTILKFQPDPFRMVRWLMNYVVLNKARNLTTNSDYLLRLLDKRHQAKAVVINNFYKSGLENHYNTGLKQDYIITVANGFGKRKNVHNALRAFALMRKQAPNLEFRLLGFDMEENGEAHRFAIKYNLCEGVKFMGNLPFAEVINQMKNARILLHPSREESFGNVLLEAMVVGTPVIGGKDSGNVPYMLDHGQYGVVCDVNDPQDIANATIGLLNNKKEMDRLKWEAYDYAVANFSEEAIVERYLSQLHRISGIPKPERKEKNLIVK